MLGGSRQAVVTGVGAVSPAGVGADALWRFCAEPASRPPVHPGGIDFEASAHLPRREARRMDRTTQMACVAADDALAASGEVGDLGARGGVVVASAYGGVTSLAEGVLAVERDGPAAISPAYGTIFPVSAPAGAIAARAGWTGASVGLAATCASGTVAVAEAARRIVDGRSDAMLAGGTEAPATPAVVAAFERLTVLCADRPRPFDVARDGFALTEGACVMVLEEAGRARLRGATPLAVVAGAAERTDTAGVFAPSDEAAVLAECMAAALDDAGVAAADVGHVSAHGTGTVANDAAEATAIGLVLGPSVPVTSVKGALGHTGGAAGAFEVALAALCIAGRTLLPTAGLERLDPTFAVDVVSGSTRPWEPGPVVSLSLGLGGQVAVIVLTPP